MSFILGKGNKYIGFPYLVKGYSSLFKSFLITSKRFVITSSSWIPTTNTRLSMVKISAHLVETRWRYSRFSFWSYLLDTLYIDDSLFVCWVVVHRITLRSLEALRPSRPSPVSINQFRLIYLMRCLNIQLDQWDSFINENFLIFLISIII